VHVQATKCCGSPLQQTRRWENDGVQCVCRSLGRPA
jgi:hypothetical protein